ncbi:hypothetical protein AVEN_150369-1 [Araneus ventricosus]|uniref:Uncharacterized protein n=1 Tax=Araneus ventricosus TaxID=182803 RepID=A0A4Y2CRN6_ARAVE|nr:hypothetical protein AVEN_150369-1 [Araneus ventricosus]
MQASFPQEHFPSLPSDRRTKIRRNEEKKKEETCSSLDHQNQIWATIKNGKEGRKRCRFSRSGRWQEKGAGQLSLLRTNRQVPLSILFTCQVIEPGRTSAVRTCPAPLYLQVKSRRDCTMTKKPVAFHQSCWTAQFFPNQFSDLEGVPLES